MIDVDSERLVPLAEVPALLPPNRRGRRLHISVVYRWVQKGMRGIRLEAVQLGGRRVTSSEALSRFIAALTAQSALQSIAPEMRSPSARNRAVARANAACEGDGW